MAAGQEDVFQRKHRAGTHLVGHPDGPVLEVDAPLQLLPAAEFHHPAGSRLRKAVGNGVVPVEHSLFVIVLVDKDIFLGGHILAHGLVDIQMVGGQVGDHRDLRAQVHGHELEGGQLQYRPVLGLHTVDVGQQRFSDVAAEVGVVPGGLEQRGDDGGGGGLAVAARHTDGVTGADLKKHLHL